ncbi:Leucine-rich receptor-like protein kinase family protein [Melia azedarach]|uniref:Leucine-rich receptor-like protein kinase family protein n=1 Tax=Melia azedarach TaxID=155640 RepID=A0ACC1Z4D5_MELAZ|nr:Leucine-rich receptor-like protein kinase family protein [Melia azedarach]
MNSTFCSFKYFIFLHLMFDHLITHAFMIHRPLCHDDERSSLLQFKQSLILLNKSSTSCHSLAYPKIESWNITVDCCSWDGVECDHNTGYVIGLHLSDSCLYGSIHTNSSLFQLIHLRRLSLARNDFNYSQLPASIGNLVSLNELIMQGCNFSGELPSSLGNLPQLTHLDLLDNNFRGQIPSSLRNLTKLTYLSLRDNDFNCEIPNLGSMNQLSVLDLRSNQLTGQIPVWLTNLTKLTLLDLSANQLEGPILSGIYQLKNLESLLLSMNNLNDTMELDMLIKLKKLTRLLISLNNITFIPKASPNATIQKFKALGLASCKLNSFPGFLQHQDELEYINLSSNNIHGLVPKWMWNISKNTMQDVNFSHNFLTGSDDQYPSMLRWRHLLMIDLSSNRLQGSLPVPPPSTTNYFVSRNMLVGAISPLFCNITYLQALDLSHNNLSGILPPCLGYFSSSLEILNLGNNKFHGTIPLTFPRGNRLRMIDLSQNQFQGQLPRSLVNCTMIEFLMLGNNHIHDVFPHWLGSLPDLMVLSLQYNKFHGGIGSNATKFDFPNLRVFDLAGNNFTGTLPSYHFQNRNHLRSFEDDSLYMHTTETFYFHGFLWNQNYHYSMSVTNKGTRIEFLKIPYFFSAIDLSNNRFSGEIPESIGNFKGLQLLNLSNSFLSGQIPSSLGNLTNLESLDLSRNNLSGQIPRQLKQLTFLAILNVSHNHLSGPIPQGAQFDTFERSSFVENSGLYGCQLLKKCENSEVSPPTISAVSEEDQEYSWTRGNLLGNSFYGVWKWVTDWTGYWT